MTLLIDVRYLSLPPLAAHEAENQPDLAWVLACLRGGMPIQIWLGDPRPDILLSQRQAWSRYVAHTAIHTAPSALCPITDCPQTRAAHEALDAAAIQSLKPRLFWLPGPRQPWMEVEPPPLPSDLDCLTLATLPEPLCAPPQDAPWGPESTAGMWARYWQWVKQADHLGHPELSPDSLDALVHAWTLNPQTLRAFNAEKPCERAAQLASSLSAWGEVERISRPTLAYLSPFPPAPSGIADYSAELLPELARYFRITLVNAGPPVSDPWLSACFPIMDLATFEACAESFDQIIYQMGNAEYHAHMVDLVHAWPGVIVLHDFFLGHMHAWRQFSAGEPHALTKALLSDHGWPALGTLAEEGVEPAILRYPCNRDVLGSATGVIVHSEHALRLARQWLPEDMMARFHCIPHLRRPLAAPPDRQQARRGLGLGEEDFVVCSFGFLGPTKCNHILLEAWLDSTLSERPDTHLVFVGQNADSEYGHAMARRLDAPGGNSVRITGFVDQGDYRQWLAAADVAVQLRQSTRGESSGTVLDALAHGLPVVVNAHGSMADLPGEPLWRLPDNVTSAEVRQALEALQSDPERRQHMGAAGQRVIREQHHPLQIGQAYFQALEHIHTHSPVCHYLQLARRLGRHTVPTTQLDALADALAISLPAMQPRCYMDITVLRKSDHVTGVERVTQALLRALLEGDAGAGRFLPVYEDPHAGGYREANDYLLACHGLPAVGHEPLILPRPGDLFLGLDWCPGGIVRQASLLARWRRQGVRCAFVVHDILPVTNPEWFPPHVPPVFSAWLDALTQLADDCVCVSGATADALKSHWQSQQVQAMPHIHVSHNGADFHLEKSQAGEVVDLPDPVARAVQGDCLLMVGTIEPRKGHEHALKALQCLWTQGRDIHLVIVGREGWRHDSPADRAPVTRLVRQLRDHPEQARRLHWLDHADDRQLIALYRRVSALLAASEGEGFGLPLVEAARQGLPLIVRDIPVFREVAGEGGWYFTGSAADDPQGQHLAQRLDDWLMARNQGRLPEPGGFAMPSWEESAARLSRLLRMPLKNSLNHAPQSR